METQSTFAAAMNDVHRRLAASGLSSRKVARAAGLKSSVTVLNFLRTGSAHAQTIRAIDEALGRLSDAGQDAVAVGNDAQN